MLDIQRGIKIDCDGGHCHMVTVRAQSEFVIGYQTVDSWREVDHTLTYICPVDKVRRKVVLSLPSDHKHPAIVDVKQCE